MPSRERGSTPAGIRVQLLQRLRNEALRTGIPVHGLQQRIAFERLLARLPQDNEWVLKGGLALQFRYGTQTRSTREVDLRTQERLGTAFDRLRDAVASAIVTDNLSFEFGEVARDMQGAPGGTLRVRVIARLVGTEFATFYLDLSGGDALVDAPDLLRGSDLLQFTGIAPVEFPVCSLSCLSRAVLSDDMKPSYRALCPDALHQGPGHAGASGAGQSHVHSY